MSTRLEKLQERRKKIDARIQALRSKQAHAELSKETRRKIVIGSAALKLVEAGKIRMDDLVSQLSARDRKLFDPDQAAFNKKTLQAIAEIRKGRTTPTTIDEMMAEIEESASDAKN
jgi:hypothetical protein